MPQAERVPDFVHHHFLHPLVNKLLGKLAIGGVISAHENRRGVGHLPLHILAVRAVMPSCVVVSERHSGFGRFVERHGIGGQSRHRLRGKGFPTMAPRIEEPGIEDDVCVEDLPRAGVDTGRAHREARIRSDPAESVVVDVLGVPGVGVFLLVDDNRIVIPELLEGLVPFEDPRLDRWAQEHRHGLLHPELDRLHRR